MGLTNSSVGKGATRGGLDINKEEENDKVIALAGNPNVGKSTVFNGLTGMKQHTGNWAGKTVTSAVGRCKCDDGSGYIMVDLPGTYSLMAHSPEEEVARNYICFGEPDATVVVCDATCLERNLNLVLQIMEITDKVIVCINLIDEAKRKKINIDIELISDRLGVPVVGLVARKEKSLCTLVDILDDTFCSYEAKRHFTLRYCEEIERAIEMVEPTIAGKLGGRINSRWVSLRLLEGDEALIRELQDFCGEDILEDKAVTDALSRADEYLRERGLWGEILEESIASTFVREAEMICAGAVVYEERDYGRTDRSIDKALTGKVTGFVAMIALLACIFWLTISGANYVSGVISTALFYVGDLLTELFFMLGAPEWLYGVAILGVYRVLAWVISVMLPPMAIFFPLFTILEDVGYLPRIAYNLDKPFSRCSACGKQALTMCMGFGCNAAGVVGCRIIDSPRERLLAIITNCFVPCNGKFPMLIALITIFFVGTSVGILGSLLSAVLLTLVILIGIALTFFSTWLLSKTILRGVPSSFTLELPPYRRPQVAKVLVRSVLDRTIFVLGRAVVIAAPAGCLIWIMANVTVGDASLLRICADFLDPFARILGLDGVILMAFILGLPANEIVIPIIIMAYMSEGTIIEAGSLMEMKEIFVANGWTWITAGSVILFSLLHSPCTTTLMTVKKETGSLKWTFVTALLPTAIGVVACMIFASVARLFV